MTITQEHLRNSITKEPIKQTEDNESLVKQFFVSEPPPPEYEDVIQKVTEWVKKKTAEGKKIAFVSSGGTTVPLEKNTVRYLDNFSGGKRGSTSAENFLQNGYAVIFLSRRHSLQPYARNFVLGSTKTFLDYVQQNKDTGALEISTELSSSVAEVLKVYQEVKEKDLLFKVNFITVHDYLYYLKGLCQVLNPVEEKALLYLAAAVSDFYIPTSQMATHKIQSGGGHENLNLKLFPVPKMLGAITAAWCPKAYVTTFKLETDPEILTKKATGSMGNYKQNLVIGNLLNSHQDRVTFFEKGSPDIHIIERSPTEKEQGVDIEIKMIAYVVKKHQGYCK